jgi:hypothetical protein
VKQFPAQIVVGCTILGLILNKPLVVEVDVGLNLVGVAPPMAAAGAAFLEPLLRARSFLVTSCVVTFREVTL